MECVICLDTLGDIISCTNQKCSSKVCPPCLLDHFNYAKGNQSLPLCPAPGCNHHYNWRKLTKEHQSAYGGACFSYYSAVHSGTIDSIRNKHLLIEDLKKKRIEYLSLMPAAILHVVEIALKDKLTKAKKNAKKGQEKETRRKCMNLKCSGVLNDEFTCVICSTRFCKVCEKRLTTNHTCSPEDVESLSVIKKMSHCPNCNLPIEKSEGCNYMTCATCKTKFEYDTGKEADHGSHNREVIIKNNSLSVIWEDIIKKTTSPEEFLNQVLILEKKESKKPNERRLLALIASSENEENVLPLLREFDKYYSQLTRYRQYVNTVDEIQYKMMKEELSLQELESLVDSI